MDEDKKETVTVPIGQPVGTYSIQPTVLSTSLHHQQSIKYATPNVTTGVGGTTSVGGSWFAVATKRNLKVGKHGSHGAVTENVTNVTNREISTRKGSVDLSIRKRKLNSIVEKIGNKNKESNIVGIPISIG